MFKRGRVVGNKYLIRHLIAEGGMAEIYLAQAQIENRKRRVAIKRLKPEYHKNREIIRRFAEEGHLLLKLCHPLAISGIDFLREEDEHLIVMEYVAGIELRQLQTRLSQVAPTERLRALLAIGISVCRAISSFNQNHGFVHGDLSPENIMFCFDGRIKIIDFGLSFMSSKQEKIENQIIIANRRYMAPEQMAGTSLSEQGDVYSLCLVLSELLACEKVDNFYLQRKLEQLLTKGLDLDLAKRHKNMNELLEELLLIADSFENFESHNELKTLMRNNKSKKTSSRRKNKMYPSLFETVSSLAALSFLFAWLIYV